MTSSGLWRFLVGGGYACARMKLTLFPFETDTVHRSRSHGGAIDADREARIGGESVPLEAPQRRRPGEHLFHQVRKRHQVRENRHGRGSNPGHTGGWVDAAEADGATLIFSAVVRDGSMRWRSGEAAGEWP